MIPSMDSIQPVFLTDAAKSPITSNFQRRHEIRPYFAAEF